MARPTKSNPKELSELLNEVVNQASEIDAIFAYDLDSSLLLEHSTTKTDRGGKLVDSLFDSTSNLEMGEALSEFGDIRDLPQALKSFGTAIGGGELQYSTFQLSNSIVQAYFLPAEVLGTNAAVCFVSAQPKGLGKFVLQCEGRKESIIDALKAMF